MRADSDIRVRAGALRHQVLIQHKGQTSPPTYNAAGPVLQWLTILTTRAAIEPERSGDRLANGQGVTMTYIPITIRYAPGITANMRVIAPDGITYVIQGIVNFGLRNILLELQCLALGSAA